MPVVNGKQSQGTLFETGNKTYLIEGGVHQGNAYIEARELYEKEGQLGRTKSAARVRIEDVVEFLSDFIEVSGLPYELTCTLDDQEQIRT